MTRTRKTTGRMRLARPTDGRQLFIGNLDCSDYFYYMAKTYGGWEIRLANVPLSLLETLSLYTAQSFSISKIFDETPIPNIFALLNPDLAAHFFPMRFFNIKQAYPHKDFILWEKVVFHTEIGEKVNLIFYPEGE